MRTRTGRLTVPTAPARRILRRETVEDLRRSGALVGRDVHLGPGCVLDPSHRHLLQIGDRCVLAPRVHLLAHDASTKPYLGLTRIGLVVLEDEVFLGAGSIVLPGTTVGRGSVVGAGSVVSRDVPAGTVVAGVPARTICTVDELVARRRAELATAPRWPARGWTLGAGLTAERMRLMREALRDRTGYVE